MKTTDLEGQIPACYGGIHEGEFPNNSANFGGSPAQNSHVCIADLVDTRFGDFGATRPPDPTLPSRAHPQDYGSRTIPSNYYYCNCHY